jgi:3-hydroxyacyl-[acyl-carrier-protein] dehydratase
MKRTDIEALIPHRDPFLWIDEVVEIDEQRIRAKKKIEDALDVFRGHYPRFPILPGVLQIEAAFQAGAILIAKTQQVGEGQVPVVTRLNNTKFRAMVKPGDTLDIEVELTETVSNAFFLKGKVSVDGKVTVRLEFACAAAKVE